jgi:hypothetical protein
MVNSFRCDGGQSVMREISLSKNSLWRVLPIVAVAMLLTQCNDGGSQKEKGSPPSAGPAAAGQGQGCVTVAECAQQAAQAAWAAQQAVAATDAKIKALTERLDKRGEVAAFAATSCPAPWEPYTPAVGRFVRGFDPQGTNDPDGQSRTIESIQVDMVGPHAHTMGNNRMDDGANVNQERFPNFANGGTGVKYQTDNNSGVETRPKNVALLYCILK